MMGSKFDIIDIYSLLIFTDVNNVCYSTEFRLDLSLPKINKIDKFLTDDSKKREKYSSLFLISEFRGKKNIWVF